jgi:flagellum-specific peptidoglycan hydrolase FlgJ
MEKYNFIFIFMIGFFTGTTINTVKNYCNETTNRNEIKAISTNTQIEYKEHTPEEIIVDLDIIAESLISDIDDKHHANVIKKYYKLAVSEQQKYGFPASLKLAQMLIEGGYSSKNPNGSKLVTEANNPFGIKYFGEGVPNRVQKWDELVYSKQWVSVIDDCGGSKCKFVKFKGIWHAFRFHSEFMVGTADKPSHYASFVTTGDWRDWINALMKGKYATNTNYDKQLIQIIEKYKLYKFDEFGVAA